MGSRDATSQNKEARKEVLERLMDGTLFKITSGAEMDDMDIRSRLQKLVRHSVREELRLVDQPKEFCKLDDFLAKVLFSKRRGGYDDPANKTKGQRMLVMDRATLAEELRLAAHRLTQEQIDAICRELEETDGRKGHVSMATLSEYLNYNTDSERSHQRNQMHLIVHLVRKRLAALYSKNMVSFRTFANPSGTQIDGGVLHKWVMEQKELAYDLTEDEVNALLRAMAAASNATRDEDAHKGSGKRGESSNVDKRVDQMAFEAFIDSNDEAATGDDSGDQIVVPPIVDLQVSVLPAEESDLLQQNYEQVKTRDQNGDVRACNLNEGAFTAHRVYLWYLRRGRNTNADRLMPIVDVLIEPCSHKSSLAISGYTCLRKNLNRGTMGQPQYLWIRRAVDSDQARSEALVEIQSTIGKERIQDDSIHVPPDRSRGRSDARRKREHGSGYVRVDGNLNRGSMGIDIFLWFRPRVPRSTETDLPAVNYIKWSHSKRRAECEQAFKRCVRQQCPDLKGGGPDLPALFNGHDSSGRGMLTRAQLSKLLDGIGFNLEVTGASMPTSTTTPRAHAHALATAPCFALAVAHAPSPSHRPRAFLERRTMRWW